MISDNTHISVWGRTLEEYKKMFGLPGINTDIKILSIADGPSTFNLEMRQLNNYVTSVDPIYNLSIPELTDVFAKSYQFNKDLFYNNKEKFYFKNDPEIEELLQKRKSTFNHFLADYTINHQYYQFGQLPQLVFSDDSFDLCVCSNLLFIFDHIFDLEFHIQAILEMLRVSKELRIFPLYNAEGTQSEFLETILDFLAQNNFRWSIIENDYFVYKNGNRYLKILNEELV